MEPENAGDAEELALLEQVSERTAARVNAWWRCKSCKTKKWKERAPKTIFKHALGCGFPDDLRTRLRGGLANAKLAETPEEAAPESQLQPQLKSILKKTDSLPFIRVEEWRELEAEPDDFERLEVASKTKRPSMQVDPVFHVPGKGGWTLRTDSSARRRHIRIVSDILYVSIHRRDWHRAKRAWGLLLRTPEVEWTDIWRIGLLLLNKGVDVDKRKASGDRIEWLKTMMRKIPYYRETTLQELAIELILAKDFEEAKVQLDMYTGEYPFIDNATLRGLSGLLYLYTAQPSTSTPAMRPRGDHFFSSNSSDEDEIDELESKEAGNSNEEASNMNKYVPEPFEPLDFDLFKPGDLRTATQHFRAALRVDGRNTLAYGFLVLLGDEMVQSALPNSRSSTHKFSGSDSEEDPPPPAPFLPLSAFSPPSISSDSDEFGHPPKNTRSKESAAGERLQASSAIAQREMEAGSSTDSQVGAGLYIPSGSSFEYRHAVTHANTSDWLHSPNTWPTSPLKPEDLDQVSPIPSDAPTSNNPRSSTQPHNYNPDPRLTPPRDGMFEQPSYQNASEAPTRSNRGVRFLEASSSGDDKDLGRRRKKSRR
ncbi:hypothetical protein FRC00_002057 [Tulasnella sp. 408]|nr:hypothetical protein FRC00_002057 [Tulasnella sp. 408]